MEEPDEILKSFVHGLPTTIREVIHAQCCIAFDHFEAKPGFDFSSAFDELIDQSKKGRETWRALQVAKMLGVIDVLLVPDPLFREVHEKLAEEHDEPFFAEMALRAPLRERHFERARQEYLELRDGPLAPETLRTWWNILQARNPLPRIG